jgi:hypothetical protein
MSTLKSKMLAKNPDSHSNSSEETKQGGEAKPGDATSGSMAGFGGGSTTASTTTTSQQLSHSHSSQLQSVSSALSQQQSLLSQQHQQQSISPQAGNALQHPSQLSLQSPRTQQQTSNPFEQVECTDWTEYFTKDGSNQAYYHSASLNKTVWEAPRDFLILKGAFCCLFLVVVLLGFVCFHFSHL